MFLFNGKLFKGNSINEAWYDNLDVATKDKKQKDDSPKEEPEVDNNIKVGDTYTNNENGEEYIVSSVEAKGEMEVFQPNGRKRTEDATIPLADLNSYLKFDKKSDRHGDDTIRSKDKTVNIGDVFIRHNSPDIKAGTGDWKDTGEFTVNDIIVTVESADSDSGKEISYSLDTFNNLFSYNNIPYWEKPNKRFERDKDSKESKKDIDDRIIGHIFDLMLAIKLYYKNAGIVNKDIRSALDVLDTDFAKRMKSEDDSSIIIMNALEENPKLTEKADEVIKSTLTKLSEYYNNYSDTELLSFDALEEICDVPIGKLMGIEEFKERSSKSEQVKSSSYKERDKKLDSVIKLIKAVSKFRKTGEIDSDIEIQKCFNDTIDQKFLREIGNLGSGKYNDELKRFRSGETLSKKEEKKMRDKIESGLNILNSAKTYLNLASVKNPNFNKETVEEIKENWPDAYKEYRIEKINKTVSYDFVKWILSKETFLKKYITTPEKPEENVETSAIENKPQQKEERYQLPKDFDKEKKDEEEIELSNSGYSSKNDPFKKAGVKLVRDKNSFAFVNSDGTHLYKDKFNYSGKYLEDNDYKEFKTGDTIIDRENGVQSSTKMLPYSYEVKKVPPHFLCGTSLIIQNPSTNEYEMYTPSGELLGTYTYAFQNDGISVVSVTTVDNEKDIVNSYGKSVVPEEISGKIKTIKPATKTGENVVIPLKLKDGTDGYLDTNFDFIEGEVKEEVKMDVSRENVELRKIGKNYYIVFKKNGRPVTDTGYKEADGRYGVFVVSEEGYTGEPSFDYVKPNGESIDNRSGDRLFIYASKFNDKDISIAISNEESTKRVYAIESVGDGKINVLDQCDFYDLELKNGKPIFDEKNMSKYPFIVKDKLGKKSVLYLNDNGKFSYVSGDKKTGDRIANDCDDINFKLMTATKKCVGEEKSNKYHLNSDYSFGDKINAESNKNNNQKKKSEDKKAEKKAKSNEKLKEKVKK